MESEINEMDILVMQRIRTEPGRGIYELSGLSCLKYRCVDEISFHDYLYQSENLHNSFAGTLTMFDLRAAQEVFTGEHNMVPTYDGLRFLLAKLALEQEDSLKKKTIIFDYLTIWSTYMDFGAKCRDDIIEKDMWLFPIVEVSACYLIVVTNPTGVLTPENPTKIYSIGNSKKESMQEHYDRVCHFVKACADRFYERYLSYHEMNIEHVHYKLKSCYHSSAYILALIQKIMDSRGTLPDIKQMFSEAESPSKGDPRDEQKKIASCMRKTLFEMLKEAALSSEDPVIKYIMELREKIIAKNVRERLDEPTAKRARTDSSDDPEIITLDDE